MPAAYNGLAATVAPEDAVTDAVLHKMLRMFHFLHNETFYCAMYRRWISRQYARHKVKHCMQKLWSTSTLVYDPFYILGILSPVTLGSVPPMFPWTEVKKQK